MKQKMTQEQKSLFESISQNDESALRDLEFIWDKSASYEPKVAFNKEAAYGKFMNSINVDAPSQPSTANKLGSVLLKSAIAIGLAALLFFAYNQIFSYTTITTTDNVEFATLDDGTQIWLNKHSELRYPNSFASDSRNVILKGEAYFDVARDQDSPFTVELTNDNVVTVLGTEFNVNNRYASKVEVSVTEGKVNLKNELKPELSTDLVEGERGVLNASKNKIEKVSFDNNVVAWKATELTFDAEPLEDVLADVGTFYGVQFKLDNANVNCNITHKVSRDQDVAQNIGAISKLFPSIKFTKGDKGLYWVQGACK